MAPPPGGGAMAANPFAAQVSAAQGQASPGYYPLQTYGPQLRDFITKLAQAQAPAPGAGAGGGGPAPIYGAGGQGSQAEGAGREAGGGGGAGGGLDLFSGGGIPGFQDPGRAAASPAFGAALSSPTSQWGGMIGSAFGLGGTAAGRVIGAVMNMMSGPSASDMATSASDAPAGAAIGEFGGQMGDVSSAEKAGRGGVDPG
jgi:hypothetical protein